jgi:outer membrane protein insertion porin family
MALCLLIPATVQAEKKGKVAVLPFRIHSIQPLDYLKLGLQEMLATRINKKGLDVINPDVVNKHPLAFLPMFELEDSLTLGKDLGADWVILGSLTQIGKRISLDLEVVDISLVNPPFSIFMMEDDIDRLADAVERASTSIYNQVTGVVQIDSIRVKGNRRIEKEAILALVGSEKGGSLDNDQLDKDLRAIFKMGFFTNVNIEIEGGPRGKIITFSVTEKPSIANIFFKGNKEVKEGSLKEETGIKQYSILNPSEIRQSVNRLKEYYRQKGYYNIEIMEKIEELPNNEVSLTYEIDEGAKVYITRIEFIGNTKFDDDDLKDIMETSEKGFFSWITKSGLLDEKELEFDVQKVVSFYQNHGYIRARAGEPKIFHEKEKGLTISIEIIEGDQYEVNDVKVSGDLIRPGDELLKNIGIKKEKFFNREVVRKDNLALREIYANEGYAYADVSPIIKEDDKKHLVDITYNISKGKKVRFERINISGNTITRDKVIRREFKVIEGDYFSGEALKKSNMNIHRLGYFEDVEVQTKKGSRDDLMVLNIKVKERPTGSFSMGAGFSSFEGVIGMFQLAQSNLFGYGQKISASIRLGGKTQQFDIRFTEPWLFDRPLSAGVDVFKWEREFDEFTKDSLGGALRFGFPLGLDDFTRGRVRYAYDDAEILNIQENAAIAIKDMAGRNVTSSITLGIVRDSKDRPWNVSKGSLNSVSFEYAGDPLGGNVAFNKYLVTSAWYFPLPWKTVFMARGRLGYVRGRSGGKLPIFQKFRLGGINSVRGFDFASISPKDPATGDRIGGEKMMVYNFEYRFPLVREQGVVGLVFFDAGDVVTKDEDFTFSGIRRSAGAGIRWYSPIGPLRLEWGKNLDPQGDESSSEWEFSVGGLF